MARLHWVIYAALLAAFACSNSNSALTVDKACADEAQAYCTKLDACQTAPNGTGRIYGGFATCVARVDTGCHTQLGAPGTGSSATSKEACAQAYAAATCAQFSLGNGACSPPAGNIDGGGACSFDAQCKSSFCSQATAGVLCGQCMPASVGGAACPCSTGFVCAIDSSGTATCHPLSDVGGPCDATPTSTSAQCAESLSCVDGTCELATSDVGGPCDSNADASTPSCAASLALTCVASHCIADDFADAGQPCGDLSSGDTICTGASQCHSTGSASTCVADAPDGDPCSLLGGPSCIPPARCVVPADGGVEGTCTQPDPTMCAGAIVASDGGVDAGPADGGRTDAGTRCACDLGDGCVPCPDDLVCALSGNCLGPHYTVNGNGTVADDETSLVWQQIVPSDPCPSDDPPGLTGFCTYAHAQMYCGALNLGGSVSAWRLPTLAELFSIVVKGSDPSIDSTVFPNTPPNFFWSSSPVSYGTGTVWAVGFSGGAPSPMVMTGPGDTRCVR